MRTVERARNLKNLTITVTPEVARWARVRAAHENTSVSRLVGEMLARRMRDDDGYEQAMRTHFEQRPTLVSKGRYPSRAEIYGRRRLR